MSARWSHGVADDGTGVDVMAATAAWNAATTQPLERYHSDGWCPMAASMRDAPLVATVGAHEVEAVLERRAPVERLRRRRGGDRPLDGERPQHARLDAVGVRVREGGDLAGELGDRGPITEVAEGDRRGAHQGPVAGGVRVLGLVGRRGVLHRHPVAGPPQHGGGLHADVTRRAGEPLDHRPPHPLRLDVALAHRAQHGEGELGVVGPLTGTPLEAAAALHGAPGVGAGRAELVGGAERVADGRGGDRTDRPVEHRG